MYFCVCFSSASALVIESWILLSTHFGVARQSNMSDPEPAIPNEANAAKCPQHSAEMLQRFHAKSELYFKCGTCAGQPIKQRTHFYGGSNHQRIAFSDCERLAWALKQYDAKVGGPAVQQQQAIDEVARVQIAQADHAPMAAADNGAYFLDFGKYKKIS